MAPLDVPPVVAARNRFPGLRDGWARLDGTGGTIVLDKAIEAMSDWLHWGRGTTARGVFAAATDTAALVEATRASVASLLEASPAGVIFGQSMTALTLRFALTVGRTLRPGDEIVCTRLDHDANVRPWVIAAQRAGATVRFAEPDPETLALSRSAVEAVLTPHTRWVAVTAASNAVGTVPDVAGIVTAARIAGARTFVDAVAVVAHRSQDLDALGADVLACSAHKWFGPHLGILCVSPELLADLEPDRLASMPAHGPESFELGTLPYEALIGTLIAADYVRGLDWDAVRTHEQRLLDTALDGLGAMPHVRLYGAAPDRTPTLMFTVRDRTARAVAEHLATHRVAVSDGTFQAWELARALGLEADGAVRAGFLHYNDADDVRRLLSAMAELA